MVQRFKDKVVIITGASSGIGRWLGIKFAEHGASVILAARSEDKLKETFEEIRKSGGNAIYLRTDVSIREDVKNLFRKTIEKFSKIDILVNNAGIGLYGDVEGLEEELLLKLMRTNIFGPLYCIQEAIPIMKRQGEGHIVNISSVAGRRAMPGVAGYAMTKFALHALSESLRIEMLPYNIHVTVISPGLIRTEFPEHAMRTKGTKAVFSKESRRMTGERCAEIIIDAIYKKKREQVITASGKFIVFMNKIFPSITDWLVAKVAPRLKEK